MVKGMPLWAKIALFLLTLFSALPMFFLVMTSLEGGDVYQLNSLMDILPQKWDFSSYSKVFIKFPSLAKFFLNSALVCALGVVLELILASLAGYPLARWNFKGKNWLSALLVATLVMPSQANMIVNFVTIRGLGLYDTLLAVVLPSAVSIFGIFLMRQAFLVIPKELEEAAYLDGCSHWQVFWYVMLPMVKPSLGTLALFSFVAHWNSFLWPLVVLKTTDHYTLPVGLSLLSQTFDSDFRLVAAGSVLATIPIIILFLWLNKYFVKGMNSGAVK